MGDLMYGKSYHGGYYDNNTNDIIDNLASLYDYDFNKINKIIWFDDVMFIRKPKIKRVLFHNPATIVFWCDGTKTVVKCDGEKYDPEKGLAMAISKKVLGNKGAYYDVIKKWVGDLMPAPDDKAK